MANVSSHIIDCLHSIRFFSVFMVIYFFASVSNDLGVRISIALANLLKFLGHFLLLVSGLEFETLLYFQLVFLQGER